jgi:hypothetical protein
MLLMLPKGRKISMQSFIASNEPTTSKTDYGATSCLGAYQFILPKSSPNNLGGNLNPILNCFSNRGNCLFGTCPEKRSCEVKATTQQYCQGITPRGREGNIIEGNIIYFLPLEVSRMSEVESVKRGYKVHGEF